MGLTKSDFNTFDNKLQTYNLHNKPTDRSDLIIEHLVNQIKNKKNNAIIHSGKTTKKSTTMQSRNRSRVTSYDNSSVIFENLHREI